MCALGRTTDGRGWSLSTNATRWPGSVLVDELAELAGVDGARSGGHDAPPTATVVEWSLERLSAGMTPLDLCTAALWLGLRHTRVEGRGPHGLVSHSVLAAHACATIGGSDPATAALAATQLVVQTVGERDGSLHDEREGPTALAWFEPARIEGDPAAAFSDAAAAGECDLADHRWLAAAHHGRDAAVAALISAGAAGYHLNEHKVIYPAQLLAWCELTGSFDPVLLRAAARFAANHLQDPEHALSRRADAGVLADMAELLDLDDLAASPTRPSSDGPDLERISTVATGLARTDPRDLGPLLLGSLQDGLSPTDLVHATALVTAARFADTSFGDRPPIGPVHAGTGANALRRCIEASTAPEAVYELALCATESPSLARLARIEELSVPPSDDGAVEDLEDALADGDPDAAADAASAVPPDDDAAVAAAWAAVSAAGAADQSMLLHGIKHVVAMREDFAASQHPARIWFLAAAARTAAHAAAGPTDVAEACAAS